MAIGSDAEYAHDLESDFPLLEESSTNRHEKAQSVTSFGASIRRWQSVLLFFLGLLLGTLLTRSTGSRLEQQDRKRPYSASPDLHLPFPKLHLADKPPGPAQDVIAYETRPLMHAELSSGPQFWGPPDANQTAAWQTLVEPTLMRASAEELQLARESLTESVRLKEGGYLSSLSVYHDLHCLRRLRFWIHKGIFYPNITEAQTHHELHHVEHCLEALRLSTMCSGDISLYTFRWKEDGSSTDAKSASQRSCVKWDAVESFSRQRSVGFNPRLVPKVLADGV